MGFVDDLWTVLLSGDEAEEQAALDRLVVDDVAADLAFAMLSADKAATPHRHLPPDPLDAGSDHTQP